MRRIYLSLLFSAVSFLAYGQAGHFFPSEQFSSGLINDVCQDKYGFIWIASIVGAAVMGTGGTDVVAPVNVPINVTFEVIKSAIQPTNAIIFSTGVLFTPPVKLLTNKFPNTVFAIKISLN